MIDPIHPPTPPLPDKNPLWDNAVALEGAFLAEMLGHAGLGRMPEGFGGGAGEEQFSSFLHQAQADSIARRGGIGLAERIFIALQGRHDAK